MQQQYHMYELPVKWIVFPSYTSLSRLSQSLRLPCEYSRLFLLAIASSSVSRSQDFDGSIKYHIENFVLGDDPI